MEETIERRVYEQNIESTAQFVYHELWWYEHASEKENSDSQKIKVRITKSTYLQMKKQFISNVLFPSLQLINTYLFKLKLTNRSELIPVRNG